MDCLTTLPLLLLLTLFTSTSAVNFEVHNNCSYTVWAAATPVGGGQRLDNGQSWNIKVPRGTKMGRIWGRTNCIFDGSGRGGSCQTGDCSGVLQCTVWGKPPNTLAEFAVNQYNNLDFFDISLADGFNIPMSFTPTRGGANKCHAISCTANINGDCPYALKVPGGCNSPCTTFGGQQYCCTNGSCGPTDYSRFFKTRCPDAYSYPQDDATSTFTCPAGTTDYRVVFCPGTINKMSSAINIEVHNNCPFTVWAAAAPIGGGKQLDPDQSWNIDVPPDTTTARIWGRTNCNFDDSGVGSCQTGDCGGALQCTGWGKAPNTLAEFARNQYNNSDILDISLIEGFNIPISFAPTMAAGGDKCLSISCQADIVAQCPGPLRDPGGCNNPCSDGACDPDYSDFFKTRCPNAYTSSKDNTTSNFTCLAGSTDYSVVFCP